MENPVLAVQEVISCDNLPPRVSGCGGGDVLDAWYHIYENGITTEDLYPLESYNNEMDFECRLPEDYVEKSRAYPDVCPEKMINHWFSMEVVKFECEEDIQREIFNNGPVQAFMSVPRDFFMYKSGVYDPQVTDFEDKISHSVMILGWGETDEGKKYWIGRNTWGTGGENSKSHWGECHGEFCGYFNIDRFTDVLKPVMTAALPDMVCHEPKVTAEISSF